MDKDKLNSWMEVLKVRERKKRPLFVTILVNDKDKKLFEKKIKNFVAKGDIISVKESERYRMERMLREEGLRETRSRGLFDTSRVKKLRERIDEIKGIYEYHVAVDAPKLKRILEELGYLILDVEADKSRIK